VSSWSSLWDELLTVGWTLPQQVSPLIHRVFLSLLPISLLCFLNLQQKTEWWGRGGLGFLLSVWFPVCRWEDVETVAAAFSQRCSFLTPGDALRCRSRTSWLVGGVWVKHFVSAAGPPFPISTNSLQMSVWTRAVWSAHTALTTAELYGKRLVSESPCATFASHSVTGLRNVSSLSSDCLQTF